MRATALQMFIFILLFAPLTPAQIAPVGFLKAPMSICPQNYILVPALSGYTTVDFCVAKYEAKQAYTLGVSVPQNLPWTGISRSDARAACEANGTKYKLITNDQWQTIARNIEGQKDNWSGQATVGDAYVNYGNSVGTALLVASANDDDACSGTGQTCSKSTWHLSRRIHKLSNGNWIWDFAGNASEYVNDDFNTNFANQYAMFLSTTLAPTRAMFGPAGTYTSLPANTTPYGYFGTANSTAGIGEVSRGGSYAETDSSSCGIFTSRGNSLSATSAARGFRCVYNP
jgi:hypothetical protein